MLRAQSGGNAGILPAEQKCQQGPQLSLVTCGTGTGANASQDSTARAGAATKSPPRASGALQQQNLLAWTTRGRNCVCQHIETLLQQNVELKWPKTPLICGFLA